MSLLYHLLCQRNIDNPQNALRVVKNIQSKFVNRNKRLKNKEPKGFFSSIGLFQGPVLTAGHRCMGVAALLGACFVVTHLVSVVVTCVISGFNWGVPAWVLDILGFLAGLFFAVQCWLSSNRRSANFRSGNVWIAVWAFATLGARIIDTLMLFGVVKWSAVYVTPTGAVLWSNIVSEVAFGNAFTVTALVGALILLLYPQDVGLAD